MEPLPSVHIHGPPHVPHGADHFHGLGHSHGLESKVSAKLLEHVFVYDPLSNAVIAVGLLTALTQLLVGVSPKLNGLALQFLVAFAEGSMLANVFVHMLPEVDPSMLSSLLILAGFLFFVIVDKILRLIGSEGHSHQHDDSYQESNEKLGLEHKTTAENKTTETQAEHKEAEHKEAGVSPLLNVVADSLHNVTEGISLMLAFRNRPSTGVASLLIMGMHEIPHQFGDFALLINAGMQKGAARKAQLITAMGTLVGVYLGHWFGTVGAVLNDLITPVTMGVFLYVATVNVLPELLETDPRESTSKNVVTGIIQLLGVAAGIATMVHIAHEH